MRPQAGALLFVLLCMQHMSGHGATYYVESGASGLTCLVAEPCPTLNDAITVALDGDTISIGPGDFTGAGNIEIALSKDLSFVGNGSAETFISGQPTNDSAFSSTTPLTLSFQSIGFRRFGSAALSLSGGPQVVISDCAFSDGVRGVDVTGESLTIANSHFSNAQDSAVVFTPSTASSVFSVSGCTFENNTANSDALAGAITLTSARRSSISTSTFSGNSAANSGGAIRINPGSSTLPIILFKNHFENNTAAVSGGAVFADYIVDIRDSQFLSNTAELRGGAVVVTDSADIVDSLFGSNSLSRGVSSEGGAIYFGLTSRPNVKGVTFRSNSADEGGAVFTTSLSFSMSESSFDANSAAGGSAITVLTGSASVTTTSFVNNVGETSGAIHTLADLFLTSAMFDGNSATADSGAGAAVSCMSSIPGNVPISLTVTGSSFSENVAPARGGAIFSSKCKSVITDSTFSGNSVNATTGFGGAINFMGGALTVSRTSFDSNGASEGGHIWTDDSLVATQNTFKSTSAGSGVAVSNPSVIPTVDGNTFSGNYHALRFMLSADQTASVVNSSPISGIWVSGGDLVLSRTDKADISVGWLRLPTGSDLVTHSNVIVTSGLMWGRSNITAATSGLTITLTGSSNSTWWRPETPEAGFRALNGIVMRSQGTVHIDSVDQSWNATLLSAVPKNQENNTCLVLGDGAHYLAEPGSSTYLGYFCHVLGPVSSFFNASGSLWVDGNVTINTNFTSSNETAVTYYTVDADTNDAMHFMNGPVVIGGDVVVKAVAGYTVAKEAIFSRTLISMRPGNALWGRYNNTNVTTGDAYGRVVANIHGVTLFVDEAYRPDPNSGNIAAGIAGAFIALVFLITLFFYVRPFIWKKKKKGDKEELLDEEAGPSPKEDKEAVEMARIDAEEKKKKSKPLKEKITESEDSDSEREVPLETPKDKKKRSKHKKPAAEPDPSSDEATDDS